MRGRPLAPPSRFKPGDRVRIVGSAETYAFVLEVLPGKRYRLDGRKFLYFENDLEVPA